MQITHCRLSRIWVGAAPGLLRGPAQAPLGTIVGKDEYIALFHRLLEADDDPLVTLPWPHDPARPIPPRNNYWNQVILSDLEDGTRAQAGGKAWKAMLPLRSKEAPFSLGGPARRVVEGWFHPHGAALTVTAWLGGRFDQDGLANAVWAFEHDSLPCTWPDGTSDLLPLEELSRRALARLRARAFADTRERDPLSPLRVLTIIRATNGAETDAAEPMLAAAISAAGGDPGAKIQPARNIYAWPHARLIWRPDRFLDPRPLHTLGCLHRNLVMGTLQVASLVRGADAALTTIDDAGDTVPPRLESYARAIAGLLGRIKGGVETYFQPCLADQVTEANAGGRIDRLRLRLSIPRLQ